MKVIFFGASKYVVPVLKTLNENHQVVLVVTTEVGSHEPVKFFCQNHKIECISIRRGQELIANYRFHQLNADLGIVADFGVIIPKHILHLYKRGFINIHPSLLPKYRGPTPGQTAILNGESKTGISIIKLDEQVDHGQILMQKEESIEPDDTAKTLYERLFINSTHMLLEVLRGLEHHTLIPKEQDHSLATFTKVLSREDGYFDFKLPHTQESFNNKVRAYYPWPGAWTKVILNPGQEEKIVKFLPDKKVQVEGGREMEYKDLINGYSQADSTFLEFIKKGLT